MVHRERGLRGGGPPQAEGDIAATAPHTVDEQEHLQGAHQHRLAESETEKLATLIINDAVGKQVSDGLDSNLLYNINKDSKGNISSIDFNSITVNKLLTTITSSIELNLKYLEEGRVDLLNVPDSVLVSYDKKDLKKGIIYKIPSGVIFNNTILSNIGPKVPVKLNLVGSITSNIKAKTTNYGINNALIEVYVDIKVKEKLV